MKRKSFFVVLTLVIALAVSPFSVLASQERFDELGFVSYSSSDGAVRSIDKDFAFVPIGKVNSPTKMKTAPPPTRKSLLVVSGDDNLSVLSVTNSNYQYLEDAYATIGRNLAKKVAMLGDTYSTTKVDKMVHYLTLYQYDGTTWTRYLELPSQTKANTYSFTSSSGALTVPLGYYYETELYASVQHGTRIEGAMRYSGTISVPN